MGTIARRGEGFIWMCGGVTQMVYGESIGSSTEKFPRDEALDLGGATRRHPPSWTPGAL
jgi:hypothetical protein